MDIEPLPFPFWTFWTQTSSRVVGSHSTPPSITGWTGSSVARAEQRTGEEEQEGRASTRRSGPLWTTIRTASVRKTTTQRRVKEQPAGFLVRFLTFCLFICWMIKWDGLKDFIRLAVIKFDGFRDFVRLASYKMRWISRLLKISIKWDGLRDFIRLVV